MPQPNSDLTAVSGLPKERVLLPFFAIVLLGGALLGPLLFLALRGLVPFHRTMDRALLIAALLALGSNWRRLNFSRWWRPNGLATRQALFGFIIALVSAQALLGLDLASGVRTWMPLDAHALAQLLGKTLIAALLVPLAEETIFRGLPADGAHAPDRIAGGLAPRRFHLHARPFRQNSGRAGSSTRSPVERI